MTHLDKFKKLAEKCGFVKLSGTEVWKLYVMIGKEYTADTPEQAIDKAYESEFGK